jgi:cytochrome c-type biogenesis protein CcmI
MLLAKIDQETFDALKTELERQLLSLAQEHQHSAQQVQHKLSKGVIWALFLTVLVLVAIGYRGFGLSA